MQHELVAQITLPNAETVDMTLIEAQDLRSELDQVIKLLEEAQELYEKHIKENDKVRIRIKERDYLPFSTLSRQLRFPF